MAGRLLLYYRTEEEIAAYRKKPVKLKLQWLQAQMEFFYKATPNKPDIRYNFIVKPGQLSFWHLKAL